MTRHLTGRAAEGTAVRALLDKWRSVGREATVYDVLARGHVKHSQHASPSDTLFRCAEMLADAMQVDAANADSDAADRHFRPSLVIAENIGRVDPHEVDEPAEGDAFESIAAAIGSVRS